MRGVGWTDGAVSALASQHCSSQSSSLNVSTVLKVSLWLRLRVTLKVTTVYMSVDQRGQPWLSAQKVQRKASLVLSRLLDESPAF